MRSILFFISLLVQFFVTAQMPFEKAIKKLGLTEDRVIYTSEKVKAYPRSFIHDIANPDSVFYFGCISSDYQDFKNYFEIPSTPKLAVGHKILRDLGNDTDTISCNSIQTQIQYFSYQDSSKKIKLTEGVRYFVVCYWSTETIDRHIIKNYRKFFWYVQKSTLEAKVIFVCTDGK